MVLFRRRPSASKFRPSFARHSRCLPLSSWSLRPTPAGCTRHSSTFPAVTAGIQVCQDDGGSGGRGSRRTLSRRIYKGRDRGGRGDAGQRGLRERRRPTFRPREFGHASRRRLRDHDEGEAQKLQILWVRTPVSAEGSLVSKTRKGISDGLDEFQCGPSAMAGSLEDVQEARVRSAKVLHVSDGDRSRTRRIMTYIAEDGPGLPHDRNPLLE
jgi:hypothetical protein